jgi:hypothetical protein
VQRARPFPSLALLLAAGAHSPLAAAEITLAEPAACVSHDDLEFQMERALGQPLEAAAAARFLVHVQAAQPGYRAELAISEDGARPTRGFRSLSAKTCDELTQQVALAIALALGAQTASEPAPSPPPSAPIEEEPTPGSASVEPEARHTGPALALLAVQKLARARSDRAILARVSLKIERARHF